MAAFPHYPLNASISNYGGKICVMLNETIVHMCAVGNGPNIARVEAIPYDGAALAAPNTYEAHEKCIINVYLNDHIVYTHKWAMEHDDPQLGWYYMMLTASPYRP